MKFIGVKILKDAVPMTVEEYNEKVRPLVYSGENRNGYLVTYEDGYQAWSPKKVFDEAYRPTDGMTFGLATEAAKKGLKICLPHWGEDVFISVQTPDEHSKMTKEYFYVTSRFGRVPWIPTQVELFAENWRIRE